MVHKKERQKVQTVGLYLSSLGRQKKDEMKKGKQEGHDLVQGLWGAACLDVKKVEEKTEQRQEERDPKKDKKKQKTSTGGKRREDNRSWIVRRKELETGKKGKKKKKTKNGKGLKKVPLDKPNLPKSGFEGGEKREPVPQGGTRPRVKKSRELGEERQAPKTKCNTSYMETRKKTKDQTSTITHGKKDPTKQ